MDRLFRSSYKQIKRQIVNRKYYQKKKKRQNQGNSPDEESSGDDAVSSTITSNESAFQQACAALMSEENEFQHPPNSFSEPRSFTDFINIIEDSPTDFQEEKSATLRDDLAEWASRCNTPLSSLSSLLKILKKKRDPEEYEALPVTGGTLMSYHIEKNDYTMISECGSGGEIWYKGIRTSVLENLRITPGEDIDIDVGIDGLPLFKSSGMELWPILGCARDPFAVPFIIAVYCGEEKPAVENLLKSFVTEVQYLKASPIVTEKIEKKTTYIKICNYIMDAAARGSIKCIKTYNGYYGCERCTTKGRRYKNRIIFTNLEAPLRSDDSFLRKLHKKHHTGTSPLIHCGTKMISCIPLDYMHLVCLGVMKRLFQFWMVYFNRQRLCRQKRIQLSNILRRLGNYTPREFSRKAKSAQHWKRFKATELRTFLLYTGPVVLKNILNEKAYKNFMKLSTAIYILVSEKFCLTKNSLAESLLRDFMDESSRLYGCEFVVYNVHSLIHLAAEVKSQGKPLDYFSAFKFENGLRIIKTWVKSGFKPLQQVIRRSKERSSLLSQRIVNNENTPIYRQWGKYKRVSCRKFTISTRNEKDCCVKTKFGVGIVTDITKDSDGISFFVKLFGKHRDCYTNPCHSGELGIYELQDLSSEEKKIRLQDILAKCFMLKEENNKMIAIPLAHAQ